ncbi:MAG: glycogen debranching protein, partial [Mucilaginibacter sp.]
MRSSFLFTPGLLLISSFAIAQNKAIYTSKAYTVYPDRIVQGKYTAKAVSATELTSDYRSPANRYKSPVVEFKFSINGKDNEMVPGNNHHFSCIAQSNETPAIKFGETWSDKKVVPHDTYLKPATQFKIRLDMRAVLKAFKDQGHY